MPQHSVGEYAYFEQIELTQADFTDGQQNGTAVSAGEIGEFATAEVGEDGQLSGYDIVTVGGRKEDETDTSARLFVDIEDGGDTDTEDTTQYRFVAKDKNGNRVRALTRWFSQRTSDTADPRQRPEVVYRGFSNHTWVRDGKLLAWEIKNESTSITESRPNSVLQLPAIAGSK